MHRTDDLVLVHRLKSLLPAPGVEFRHRVDVYDFDDAMYLQAGVGTGGMSHLIKRESQRWHRYVKEAAIVIAGNPTLATAALEVNRRVEVLPVLRGPQSDSPCERTRSTRAR